MEQKVILLNAADIQIKNSTVQSILKTAIKILDSKRTGAKESADWRIMDALKTLRGLPLGSSPGDLVPAK